MRSSWNRLLSGLSRDIGIDLGTANTLVHVGGRGIVIREPSVIAVSREDGKPIKVGIEAKRMIGRTPANIEAIRPLKDGVIADYVHTEAMLKHFISQVTNRFLLRKCVVIGVPTGATEVERRAVLEAARNAGATHSYVIEEPLAAAIGAGLPINEPNGSIIVDIGGGTTEVAIVSMGGIVHSHSIRIAGDELDEAIIAYVKRAYNLLIGDRTAEETKIDIGSAMPLNPEMKTEIRGRDLVTGLPKSAMITSEEVRVAISEPVHAIVQAVKVTLEATPPELAADAMDRGITLAGGGALLRGIDKLLEDHTLMKVQVARDPLCCVVIGAGYAVERMHDNAQVRRMLEKASLR
ncbi:MAG: rod shape-determining protein [Fimbriimonadales bacterium]